MLQLLGVALGVGGAVLATLSVPAAAHPGAMQNSSTDRTSSDSSAAKASVFFGLQAGPAFPSAPEPDYRICDFVKHQFLISRLGTRKKTRATQRLCLGTLGKALLCADICAHFSLVGAFHKRRNPPQRSVIPHCAAHCEPALVSNVWRLA